MMDERYKKDWLFALFSWVINKLTQLNGKTLFLLLRIATWKRNQNQPVFQFQRIRTRHCFDLWNSPNPIEVLPGVSRPGTSSAHRASYTARRHLHISSVIEWRTHFYRNKFNLSRRDQSRECPAHVFPRREHRLTIFHRTLLCVR